MLEQLIRPNILNMAPYASARHENENLDAILLDANENPYSEKFGRYPDPDQNNLKKALAAYYKGNPNALFLGNGSDEPIDLLLRIFCEPGLENIVITAPTYGMYKVSASINNVAVVEVPLAKNFALDADALLATVNEKTKIIFLCSPNNPSGNILNKTQLLKVVQGFKGMVVVDQAYIDFCPEESLLDQLGSNSNLIILQTLSKAWGLAGLRVGLTWADPRVIDLLNKIKPPYNISSIAQEKALEVVNQPHQMEKWVEDIKTQKSKLEKELLEVKSVLKIHPSDANFLLVKFQSSERVFKYLKGFGIVIRDRSKQMQCQGCLRISVGNANENKQLIKLLKSFK